MSHTWSLRIPHYFVVNLSTKISIKLAILNGHNNELGKLRVKFESEIYKRNVRKKKKNHIQAGHNHVTGTVHIDSK